MGEVDKARDSKLGRDVAIKVLRDSEWSILGEQPRVISRRLKVWPPLRRSSSASADDIGSAAATGLPPDDVIALRKLSTTGGPETVGYGNPNATMFEPAATATYCL